MSHRQTWVQILTSSLLKWVPNFWTTEFGRQAGVNSTDVALPMAAIYCGWCITGFPEVHHVYRLTEERLAVTP